MSIVMSIKEETELNTMRKASSATVDVFSKYLKEQIMDIVDRDKKVQRNRKDNIILFRNCILLAVDLEITYLNED